MKSFTIILLCLVALLTTAYCWPRIRLRLPRIRLPPVRLPRIRLPRIRLRRIRLSSASRYYTTTATGRVMCNFNGEGHPLKHVKVKLKDHDTILHDLFGETRTDDNGRFTVSGKAKDPKGTPDPFIGVFLEYSGPYGKMDVKNNQRFPIRTTRCTKTRKRSYERHINFGDIVCISWASQHCAAYVMFYEALKEYRERTGGKPLPYNHLTVHANVYHLSNNITTFAQRHTVIIPWYSNLKMETARHELAHTIRQTLVRII